MNEKEVITNSMLEYIFNNLNWIVPIAITAFFSIITTIFSFLNYLIVRNQKKLQNDSFCFQLFDRRLCVYTSIKEIISNIIGMNSITTENLNSFLQKSRDVDFLFGKEVSILCSSIYNTMLEYHNTQALINNPSNKGRFAPELVEKETCLLEKLSNDGQQLGVFVEKYISFADYKTF